MATSVPAETNGPTVSKEELALAKELIKNHEFLRTVEFQNRVKIHCEITNHEFLANEKALEAHFNSKKFKRAKEWYCHDYSKYEPYIVSHKRLPKSLYCNVTKCTINRIPEEVEQHVNGKKYKRMKEEIKYIPKEQDNHERGEFEADRFEFENTQLIMSDDQDDDDQDEHEQPESENESFEQDEEEEQEGNSDDNEEQDDDNDEQDDDNEEQDDDNEEQDDNEMDSEEMDAPKIVENGKNVNKDLRNFEKKTLKRSFQEKIVGKQMKKKKTSFIGKKASN